MLVRYSACDLKASHQKRKGKGEIKALKERNAFFSTQTKYQIRLHCHKEQLETRKVMASISFVLSGTRDTQGICVPKTHLFELLRLYNYVTRIHSTEIFLRNSSLLIYTPLRACIAKFWLE